MKDFIRFYKELLGFEPYDFQVKVAELLLQGKNVVLCVPTGAGKTWASVMPFLYAWKQQLKNFPLKLVYSLPQRTLTNSIYTDVNKLLQSDTVRDVFATADYASIQTGEYSDDPYFEKPIVFSTIDQTLSSFLSFPLSLSERQANLNAGVFIGSYLVFDEFHLLDPKLSMATTLGMIRMLKGMCRVCIMTATLTDEYIRFLKQKLDNFEVVSIRDFPEDKARIKSLLPALGKDRKKSVFVTEKIINAEDILAKHRGKTIVICNRIETAQKIFLDIVKKKTEATEVICLHSRFFDSDRKKKEQLVKAYFGKHSKKRNVILVATQVIEAGMDISCDVMHTEISPVNSFLQRAGRCARFENEYGEIFVYDVLNAEEKEKIVLEIVDEQDKKEIGKLNNRYLPYDEKLCKKSLAALKQCTYLDEKIAERLVNEVLGKDEEQKTEHIAENGFNWEIICEAWEDCKKTYYRKAIRDIQSIEIALIDVEEFRHRRIVPRKYETISVYRWSFIGWAKRWMQDKEDGEWILAKAEPGEESSFDFDCGNKGYYYLRSLDFEGLKKYYDVVFVDNRYLDYNEAGLVVAKNMNRFVSPVREGQEKEKMQITFRKDTFYEHSRALLNCFETEFKPYLKISTQSLNYLWKKEVDWERIVKVILGLHDYGKLNIFWQKPMVEFQEKKTGTPCREVLAHTDYNEITDRELAIECRVKKKPPHAGIGARQVFEVLLAEWGEEGEDLARIAAYAVLKHHSVETNSCENFSIPEKYILEVEKLFEDCPLKGKFLMKGRKEVLNDIIIENDKEQLTYFFLVRLLRMCDQKATENMEKYYTR